MRPFVLLLALCLMTACGTQYRDPSSPITPQADFDPSQYLGTWYEIARFPVSFQEGCTATTATYGLIDDNTISVVNRCRDGAPDGPMKEITGTATIEGPGQLRVKFASVPFVRAPYWVLWVDEDYDTAVVGVPNGRAGWILARTPDITPETRMRAEDILRTNGYDTLALIEVPHQAPSASD